MLTLETTQSHLYPGARGVADAPFRDGPVIVTFADGVRVPGRLLGGRLDLDAHETASGTAIPAKSWTLTVEGRAFRVTARVT